MKRLVLLLFLLMSFAVEITASNHIIRAVTTGDKLLLNFSAPIDMNRVHPLVLKSDTVRYVFDVGNTVIGSSRLERGLKHAAIKSFRISQFRKRTIRIVIEAYKTYPITHRKTSAKQLSITLPSAPSTVSGLFESLSTKNRKVTPQKPKQKMQIFKRRYTVVVDAGHGGKDSGALCCGSNRYMEKTVVLKIAKRLKHHLKKFGFQVYMTRNKNRFVKLGERTRYANRKNADAFVSIHANAAPKGRQHIAHGIETYFLQVSRSARSKRVAARENSVVRNQRDRISKNVILNLMTGPKIVMSNKLAIDVQRGMLTNLKKKFQGIKDNGVRPAPFWVLVGAQMPSILVETGYITNPAEKKRLFMPAYQDLIAKGIAQGISNYFVNHERELE